MASHRNNNNNNNNHNNRQCDQPDLAFQGTSNNGSQSLYQPRILVRETRHQPLPQQDPTVLDTFNANEQSYRPTITILVPRNGSEQPLVRLRDTIRNAVFRY